jgi:hypothetical protein
VLLIVWDIVRQFVLCVDALFSYSTENRIPIRFAANRTGNRIRVDGPLYYLSIFSLCLANRVASCRYLCDLLLSRKDKKWRRLGHYTVICQLWMIYLIYDRLLRRHPWENVISEAASRFMSWFSGHTPCWEFKNFCCCSSSSKLWHTVHFSSGS